MVLSCLSIYSANIPVTAKNTYMYSDRKEKTTSNHRLLFSLLLLVVGGLGLAHAGYNVGVGRADITGPAAEVSPTQFTWHLPFYDERRRSALLLDFPQVISTIASGQSRTFWAYYCLLYVEVVNYRRRCLHLQPIWRADCLLRIMHFFRIINCQQVPFASIYSKKNLVLASLKKIVHPRWIFLAGGPLENVCNDI
jgi:hypothetical protein